MTYSLRSLLLALVVIALALGAFGPWGLAVGAGIVGGVGFLRAARRAFVEMYFLAASIAFVAAMLFLLVLPALRSVHESPQPVACINNLSVIAVALRNYERRYGAFPPAYVPGPDGKPWHSWRVLILPFLDHQALYASYNFSEPWDGPNNRELVASMPPIYVCPSRDTRRSHSSTTTYFAVVGPETAWPGAKPRPISEMHDDSVNTILVMEAHGADVLWTEPRDLEFDQVARQSQAIAETVGAVVHTWSSDFFHVVQDNNVNLAFADGRVRAVHRSVSGHAIRPLLTVQDGDYAVLDLRCYAGDGEDFVSGRGDGRKGSLGPVRYESVQWPRILSLAVLVLSTLLLWRSTRPAAPDSRRTGDEVNTSQ